MTGALVDESPEERSKRHAQRVLFDAVAGLYEATRAGYPTELVDDLLATADVSPDSAVLEIGCGTGQLTEQLAGRGLDLLAVDIGAALVDTARRRVGARDVRFAVTPFEDLDLAPHSLQLIVSATAYHWIDPEVRWTKPAMLLRPGGWLALLSTAERYDDPFGAALREVWIRYSDDGGAFATDPRPSIVDELRQSALFGELVERRSSVRRTMSPDAVFDVEQTRATVLHYPPAVRDAFDGDLRALLDELDEVRLRQDTLLVMAPVV